MEAAWKTAACLPDVMHTASLEVATTHRRECTTPDDSLRLACEVAAAFGVRCRPNYCKRVKRRSHATDDGCRDRDRFASLAKRVLAMAIPTSSTERGSVGTVASSLS